MPRKCDHLDECDDCAKKIPEKPSEAIGRVQQILTTLERKQIELRTAVSNENRFKISIESGLKEHRQAVEAAETSLEQTKLQLVAELRKMDPAFQGLSISEGINA